MTFLYSAGWIAAVVVALTVWHWVRGTDTERVQYVLARLLLLIVLLFALGCVVVAVRG